MKKLIIAAAIIIVVGIGVAIILVQGKNSDTSSMQQSGSAPLSQADFLKDAKYG